jgi:hypothetical protein
MRVGIVLNRPHPRLRTLGKRALTRGYELARGRGPAGDMVLPEFDGFAGLLDADPLVLGSDSPLDPRALARCDVVLWEWGWTAGPPARALEIRRRCEVPLVMFPGPLDRFWRELDPRDLPVHWEALRATDAIGVMLRDTAGFYAALAPGAHVFHLPVPVDVERFAGLALAPAARTDGPVLLTAPTRFCGPASQLPITTFLALAELRRRHPRLEGLCFCYDDEERRQTEAMVERLGLAGAVEVRSFVRPLGRFLDLVKHCRLGISLPHAMIQGRTALVCAALGIPLVVSDDIETHRALYPQTSVRWYDVAGAAALAARLLDDPAFAAGVRDTASAAVEYYTPGRARARLAAAVETVRGRRAVREGA